MGGGREGQEGGDLWLIHVDIWQKPTQYSKTTILQLKINKFFKKKFKDIKYDGLKLKGKITLT